MKFTAIFLIVALILPATSNAFLIKFIVNLFLPRLTQAACDQLQKALKIETTTTCECDGEFLGVGQGFEADVACTLKQNPCLIPGTPPSLCVKGTFGTTLAFGLSGGASADADITGCFEFVSGLPLPGNLSKLGVDKFCVTAKPNSQLKLASCKAEFSSGATKIPCNSCNICNNGAGFQFDCGNVNLAPPTPPPLPQIVVPGPNITGCLGVSFGNSTTASRFLML